MPEEDILHQAEVEAAVSVHVVENFETWLAALSTQVAIANPGVPGAAYVEAEVVALRTAIVAILGVLRTPVLFLPKQTS